MDNIEELKVEFDIVKGIISISRETPGGIQVINKEITREKDSSAKDVRQHIMAMHGVSNKIAKMLDTRLYEALFEFDAYYKTDYLSSYVDAYYSQDVIMKNTETKKEYYDRRKQIGTEELRRAGISISYKVGVIGASKKVGIIERIKWVMLAKKQSEYIGADYSYKFKLNSDEITNEHTYLSDSELKNYLVEPEGYDDLKDDPDFEIIYDPEQEDEQLDFEEPQKLSTKDSLEIDFNSIRTFSKSSSIQASKNMPRKFLNICRKNKIGEMVSIVDLKFQEMRNRLGSLNDIFKKNKEKQNKSKDNTDKKPSILERIIQGRIFDLEREELKVSKGQSSKHKPDETTREKIEQQNDQKPDKVTGKKSEGESKPKLDKVPEEKSKEEKKQNGKSKKSSLVQKETKSKKDEEKPKKLISKRKSIQALKREQREAMKYKNSYRARIEEMEKARARREARAKLSEEEKARLRTERYREEHRAPLKRPIERTEPVAKKPATTKSEKVVYKKKTKFTRKLKTKDNSVKNKTYKGIENRKKIFIAGAMGVCFLACVGSSVTLATNILGGSYDKIETQSQIGQDVESLNADENIKIVFEGDTVKLVKEDEEKPVIEINIDENDSTNKSIGESSDVKIVGMDTEEETEAKDAKEEYLNSVRVGSKMNIDNGKFFENPDGTGKYGSFESHAGEVKSISIIGIQTKEGYISITDDSESLLDLKNKYPNAKFSFHVKDDAGHELGWVTKDSFVQTMDEKENYIIEDER